MLKQPCTIHICLFYPFFSIMKPKWAKPNTMPLTSLYPKLGFQNTTVRQLRMVQREMPFEHNEGLQAKGKRGSEWLWVLVEVWW